MKNKQEVLHVWDTVEIVNPIVISRIGYEFTHEDAVKEIKAEYMEDIYALLRKVKASNWEVAKKKILSTLAYDLVHKKIKNGNERKIYSELQEDLRGKTARIVSKKIAQTGIYYPQTSVGFEDYEPAGLKDIKTHLVFEINLFDPLGTKILIERCNIQKFIKKH